MRIVFFICIWTLDVLVVGWYVAMIFNKKFRLRFNTWLDKVDPNGRKVL